jgi:hypothetical protein
VIGKFENSRLRLPFEGSDSIERNFSQAGQDLFVLSVLDGKRDGVFLDLGCNQPILINNTFLLESEFGWRGLSVDIDPGFFELFVFRKCETLVADCTKLDWDRVIDTLGTRTVDYLSLDLEPPAVTLEALRSIPFDEVAFGVITFEHDAYRSSYEVRMPAREIFERNGYIRICSDVRLENLPFEDWYINPRIVDAERAKVLAADDRDWKEVIFTND